MLLDGPDPGAETRPGIVRAIGVDSLDIGPAVPELGRAEPAGSTPANGIANRFSGEELSVGRSDRQMLLSRADDTRSALRRC